MLVNFQDIQFWFYNLSNCEAKTGFKSNGISHNLQIQQMTDKKKVKQCTEKMVTNKKFVFLQAVIIPPYNKGSQDN